MRGHETMPDADVPNEAFGQRLKVGERRFRGGLTTQFGGR